MAEYLIMYLVDTNIWLERLLNQERANEVAQFLRKIPSEHLMITDFTFHSIGVILSRHDEQETLQRFTQDVLIDSAVTLVSLGLGCLLRAFFDEYFSCWFDVCRYLEDKLQGFDNRYG